jgi:integrase
VTIAGYLQSLVRREMSSGTVATYGKVLRLHERELRLALVDVEPARWEARVDELRGRYAAITVATHVRIVRGYLRWARVPVPDCLYAPPRLARLALAWVDALAGWEEHLRACGHPSTTIRTRRQHLEQFADQGGSEGPYAAERGDLVGWLAGHAQWSSETRYGHRSSLRSFYAWAAELGHVAENPAATLPRVRRAPPVPRPLPARHLQAAASSADERLALMLVLAAGHGLRRGEIARVHSRDVMESIDGAPALLVHGKGGKAREVPISEDLAELLLAFTGYAFPGQIDGHLSAHHVGTLISRALPEGWSAHAGRHLFASTAYRLDRDLLAVQELLGHASPETTRRYVQTDDSTRRVTVRGVAELLPVRLPRQAQRVASVRWENRLNRATGT